MDNKAIIVLIVFVQFINAMDFVMVMPMGPDLALGLDFLPEYISWLASAYTISAAIVAIISGLFLDKLDRKKVLIFSLLGLFLATLCGGLANDFQALLGSRIIAGGFGGIAISMGLSIVADSTPESQRGKALSLVMAGFPLSAILGIPLALYISEQLSWHWAFYLLSAFTIIVTIIISIKMPPMVDHRRDNQGLFPLKTLYSRPEMAVGILATGICVFPAFLFVPHISTILQFNYAFPREYLSFLYLATGISNLSIVLLTGVLVDRFGTLIVTLLLVVLFCGNMYLWILSSYALPAYLHHMLFFITFTAYLIPVTALTSKIPLPHQRAGFSAFQSCFQHLATGTASMLSFFIIRSEQNGKLNHLEDLAMIAIISAIFIPLMLKFIRDKLTMSHNHSVLNKTA